MKRMEADHKKQLDAASKKGGQATKLEQEIQKLKDEIEDLSQKLIDKDEELLLERNDKIRFKEASEYYMQ